MAGAVTGVACPHRHVPVAHAWPPAPGRTMLSTVVPRPTRPGGRPPRPGPGVAVLALAAPGAFVVGLVAAEAAQPRPDPAGRSLSALAGGAASAPWIMASTLAAVGLISVAVAVGLRGLPAAPRVVLGAAGGLLVVAAGVPQPAGGTSVTHMVAAGAAWAGFVAWPLVLACSRGVGRRLRRASVAATGVLLVLAVWFACQLVTGGAWYATSQRLLLLALAVWPASTAIAVARAGSRRAGGGRSHRSPSEAVDLPRPGSPGR